MSRAFELDFNNLEGGGKQSAGRRGHCLMSAWVFLNTGNVSEMWRICARRP